MRLILALLLLLCAGPAAAQQWGDAQSDLYWPLKQARIEAYRTHDRAFFEALLAQDFVGLGVDGRRVSRDEYLAAEFGADRPQGPSTETEVQNFSARRDGSVLVFSYEEIERTRVGADEFREHLARLDVYVRQHGRWRLRTMSAARIPEAPAAIHLSEEALAAYVGAYQFGPDIRSVVTLANGRLLERTTGQEQLELVPIGPDTFYEPPDIEARVVFERDSSGRVIAQVYRSGSQSLRAPRAD